MDSNYCYPSLQFRVNRVEEKMKKIVYFKCEICGKLSEDREEILQCEASHYGLTVAEKQEWDNLKEECRYADATVNRTNNEETRKRFDSAAEKRMNFEREHNIEKCMKLRFFP